MYTYTVRNAVASICGEDCVYLPCPSPPLPLEVGPLKCSRGVRESVVSSPYGIWGGAKAEIKFYTFLPQNLTSSGNDSNDFPDKSTGQI